MGASYRDLLAEIDAWFRSVQERHGGWMKCGSGCSDCCHGVFDLGPHDVAIVRDAYRALPAEARAIVRAEARRQTDALGLEPPYELEGMSEAAIDALAEKLGPVACPLLDPGGRCRIYAERPSTCRFMGLPLVDAEDGVVHAEWCFRNFEGTDALKLPGLAFGYHSWEEDVDALPPPPGPRSTFIACAILSADEPPVRRVYNPPLP
ncbi:MAG: YkgJ family cysteine cluster protein [Planctomycetes bacterium]|nr:YkgJ family cysteine cluster protein [Planctomycetota bacterium]